MRKILCLYAVVIFEINNKTSGQMLTLAWKYSNSIWRLCDQMHNEQDACRGVHSACRREVNRHKLDICVLRLRQGRIQAFSYVGQNFLVLKSGGGLD